MPLIASPPRNDTADLPWPITWILSKTFREELGIGVRVGSKCVESLHEYDHGSFRIVAYFVEWLTGNPRPNVHDRVAWVRPDDIQAYQLLPADIPIAASLKKLREMQ